MCTWISEKFTTWV